MSDKASGEQMPWKTQRIVTKWKNYDDDPTMEMVAMVPIAEARSLLADRKRMAALEEAAKEVLEDADLAEFPYSDGHRVQHFIEAIAKLRAALAEAAASKASLAKGGE